MDEKEKIYQQKKLNKFKEFKEELKTLEIDFINNKSINSINRENEINNNIKILLNSLIKTNNFENYINNMKYNKNFISKYNIYFLDSIKDIKHCINNFEEYNIENLKVEENDYKLKEKYLDYLLKFENKFSKELKNNNFKKILDIEETYEIIDTEFNKHRNYLINKYNDIKDLLELIGIEKK